eukprot:a339296_1180.p1 GENE.a339296_1180~~a339296_1180.p1  ORF type:complete len:495 (-),score=216.40 a339296_1180:25-1476(-)
MSVVNTVLRSLSNPYVLIVIVLVALFLVFVVGVKPKGSPPIVSVGLPIIGPIRAFLKNPFFLALDSYKKYGEVFTIKLLHKRLTFLVGPEAGEHFFKATDEQLSQNEIYAFSVEIFGKGVVYDVEPSVRLEQIRFISGALRGEQLKSYVPDMRAEAEQFFAAKWGSEGVIDLRESLSELIILTAARCLMGPEIRENLFERVSFLFNKLDAGLLPLTVFWPTAPIRQHRERDAAREEMVQLFASIMAQRKANPGRKYNDVLDVFMSATYKDGRALTEREIAGLMIALLFAGQHTSSITSSWTGLQLLRPENRRHLEAVLREQDALIQEFGDELNYDVIEKMDRLYVSIKEALRLNPPLPFVMRATKQPFEAGGYIVPAGDLIFVSPPLSHRMERIFKDCETFDPERFLAPRFEDRAYRYAYAGFGGGRHACLGENFAYLQIKTIWSVLFRKYDMELVDPYPTPDWEALVVGNHPCRIRYSLKKA